MKVRQLPDQLVVSDFPAGMWLFGFYFVLIGSIFIAGTAGLFINSHELSLAQKALVMFIALGVVSGGLWVIYQHPQSISVFDKKDQTMKLKRRGLSATNDDENGEAVPLTRSWRHSSQGYEKVAKEVREYLNIQGLAS